MFRSTIDPFSHRKARGSPESHPTESPTTWLSELIALASQILPPQPAISRGYVERRDPFFLFWSSDWRSERLDDDPVHALQGSPLIRTPQDLVSENEVPSSPWQSRA